MSHRPVLPHNSRWYRLWGHVHCSPWGTSHAQDGTCQIGALLGSLLRHVGHVGRVRCASFVRACALQSVVGRPADTFIALTLALVLFLSFSLALARSVCVCVCVCVC